MLKCIGVKGGVEWVLKCLRVKGGVDWVHGLAYFKMATIKMQGLFLES